MDERMQFTDLNSYFAVLGWWESWKTETLDAIEKFRFFSGPAALMLINTSEGWKAAYPGDWITRDADGEIHVAALPTPPDEATREEIAAVLHYDREVFLHYDREAVNPEGCDLCRQALDRADALLSRFTLTRREAASG